MRNAVRRSYLSQRNRDRDLHQQECGIVRLTRAYALARSLARVEQTNPMIRYRF
jgi:hypothetical protein